MHVCACDMCVKVKETDYSTDPGTEFTYNLKEERLTFAHSFSGFYPWSDSSKQIQHGGEPGR